MSVTKNDIVEEIYRRISTKTCCTKAFLCGLIYSAQRNDDGSYTAMFYDDNDAYRVMELIDSKFSGGDASCIDKCARGGHRAFALTFASRSLGAVLGDIDEQSGDIMSSVGFRCPRCAQSFVCGVIISSGKISYPKIGYNFEFSMINEQRAEALRALLSKSVAVAGKVKREQKIGLYFKSSENIFDLLQYAGLRDSAYAFYDTMIERNMRNNANRSTNCTTRNILRAVDSNRRVIDAINSIKERGMTHLLSKELEYTAALRIENDSASLSELAALHNPPISKSGLNARLKKIVQISQKNKAT